MNLAIDRVEVIQLTKMGRTKTFDFQDSGDLKVQSTFQSKSWFDLAEVLKFMAAQHGYPKPEPSDIERQAQWILSARLKNQTKSR